MNICHVHSALMSKLHGVMLSLATENLNTLVSLLVRVRICEYGGNPLHALEDLVPLLSKIKRYKHCHHINAS